MSKRDEAMGTFWNRAAKDNAELHILGDPALTEEAAFARQGEEDAHILSAFFGPDDVVADLGCGIGRVMKPLAPHCREIVGVDVSEEMAARGRDYLKGVGNARMVVTDGAKLPTIADGSLAFLYSLLCLIHVDKRAGYRYFKEIHRALRPGGLTLVQVHDIMTDEGLALFEGIVESDYPLEFYTEPEVRRLLASVGLDVISVVRVGEFLNVLAIKGRAAEWLKSWLADVTLNVRTLEGSLSGSDVSVESSGRAVVEVANGGDVWRSVRPTILFIDGEGREMAGADATVRLAPGARILLEVTHKPRSGVVITSDDEGLLSARSLGAELRPGPCTLHAVFGPPGVPWSDETAPSLASHSRYDRFEVTPRASS